MSEQRQKIQLELALRAAGEGEARTATMRGFESLVAERETESPATERMMEEICEVGNLRKALEQVRANKGAPGVDGTTVEELVEYFGCHEAELHKQLLGGHLSAAASKASRDSEGGRRVAQAGHPDRERPAGAASHVAGYAAQV
jgi:hypothetical protein